MTDDISAQKVDPRLIAQIVGRYVAHNGIGVDQAGELIATVHRTLSSLGASAPLSAPEPLVPAVPIRGSVQPDYVVCLECGFRGLTLRRYLRVRHRLQITEYRARWNLSPEHAVTAPAYSARRSTMAKQIGLGRQPASVEPPTAPKRRGRPPWAAAT